MLFKVLWRETFAESCAWNRIRTFDSLKEGGEDTCTLVQQWLSDRDRWTWCSHFRIPIVLKKRFFRLIFWRHVKSTEPGPLTFSFFTRPIPLASYLADFPWILTFFPGLRPDLLSLRNVGHVIIHLRIVSLKFRRLTCRCKHFFNKDKGGNSQRFPLGN